jgi:hypothetical protein
MSIRVDFWGDEFSVAVDGKVAISGKRAVPADGIQLRFQGGDNWSKGTCSYSKFTVYSKASK